jgi:hypothetical protein
MTIPGRGVDWRLSGEPYNANAPVSQQQIGKLSGWCLVELILISGFFSLAFLTRCPYKRDAFIPFHA